MRRRPAFTIVELLVATALIVLIMAILSEAFVQALEAFRQLKAIGDMQERMRVATNHLRLDLLGRHFEGNRKLSQFGNTARPSTGFLRIQQMSAPLPEGQDDDGLPSTRNAPGCVLHFSVHQVGGSRESYYTARIPPPVAPASTLLWQQAPVAYREQDALISQWVEVAYWLAPEIDPTTGLQQTAGGTTPLWVLRRRARVVVSPNTPNVNTESVPSILLPTGYPEVSCQPNLPGQGDPNFLHFNTPEDLAGSNGLNRPFRAMADPATLASVPYPRGTNGEDPGALGDDILLGDVISFDVKVLQPGKNDPRFQATYDGFEDLATATVPPGLVPPYVAGTLSFPGGVYDSATTTLPPQAAHIIALKIMIRVYDYKTQQSRQITVIQDM